MVRFESKFDKQDLVYMLTPCDSIQSSPYYYPTIIRGIVRGIKVVTNYKLEDTENNGDCFMKAKAVYVFSYDIEITAAYDLYSGDRIDLSNPVYKFDNDPFWVSEKDLMRVSELNSRISTINRTLEGSKLLSGIINYKEGIPGEQKE